MKIPALLLALLLGNLGAGTQSVRIWSIADVDRLTTKLRNFVEPRLAQHSAETVSGGLWFGYHDTRGNSFGEAMGFNDIDANQKASPEDQLPLGSTIKPFVMVAIMRLAENGTVSLDDRIVKYVQPWFEKYAPANFESRRLDFYYGPEINHVTIRHCLTMSSGVPDYDDGIVEKITLKEPDVDLSPWDYMRPPLVQKGFEFFPGTGIEYTSLGYQILGMVLAAVVDRPWQEVTPLDFFPRDFVDTASKGLTFTNRGGRCSTYPHIAHGYLFKVPEPLAPWPGIRTSYDISFPGKTSNRSQYIDMVNYSCLNGWMFGSMNVDPRTIAYFWEALLSKKSTLINEEHKAKVVEGIQATIGWGVDFNVTFGYGSMIFDMAWLYKDRSNLTNEQRFWAGHGGQDYGTGGISYYIPPLDGGFSFLYNRDPGSNSDLTTRDQAYCFGLSEVLRSLGPDDYPELIDCANEDFLHHQAFRNHIRQMTNGHERTNATRTAGGKDEKRATTVKRTALKWALRSFLTPLSF